MVTTPRLNSLKNTRTLRAFAPLVEFTPKGLAYTLYKIPELERYRTFSIPKKGGGERTICAPEPRIALLQSRLARLLRACIEELENTERRPRSVNHGFHPKRSIVTNARSHKHRRYVLNFDLVDFFGSINFGRVRGLFIKDNHFTLDPAIATIIAQIVCHNNSLPQGAPSSPIISNLIGNILDTRLARLAKRYGCYYTRYVDDLTISTNAKAFPELLASRLPDTPNSWEIGDALTNCIERTGFAINERKTRMQIRGSRQEVTGLIVNEKVNIKAEYYRTVRSMCNSLFQTGFYFVPNEAERGVHLPQKMKDLSPLEGRLSHIYYVKDRRDLDAKVKAEMGFRRSKGMETLYKRFLIYKYFVASDLPVIVTEGKTDIIYLRCAIMSLQQQFPDLVTEKGGRTCAKARFVRPSYINQRVLGLGEGTGCMVGFIERYEKLLQPYKVCTPSRPAIFVLDNDTGGEQVFKWVRKQLHIDVGFESPSLFFHLKANLYLVKTPSKEARQSCMEDLFPTDILNTLIDKKPFDKNKKTGDHKAYGKVVFADRVVRPLAAQIDFIKFAPLLEGIVGSINHYDTSINEGIQISPGTGIAGRS